LLFLSYVAFTAIVYTKGTDKNEKYSVEEQQQIKRGKELFQKHNCSSCHQLYGLGGYLGPELTTAWSDKHRGKEYMKVLLIAGGPRMPKYNFSEKEINSIIAYLRYVDSTASTYKK
jgi:nitric oxide reductase subunit C